MPVDAGIVSPASAQPGSIRRGPSVLILYAIYFSMETRSSAAGRKEKLSKGVAFAFLARTGVISLTMWAVLCRWRGGRERGFLRGCSRGRGAWAGTRRAGLRGRRRGRGAFDRCGLRCASLKSQAQIARSLLFATPSCFFHEHTTEKRKPKERTCRCPAP